MSRKYFLTLVGLCVGCIFLIAIFMWREGSPPSHKEKFVLRPISPYPTYIAANGIVEASTGNINIGTPVNRIVHEVAVSEGQKVKKGDVLLRLEDRDLAGELLIQLVAYESALAQLNKLQALPREEDLVAAEANYKISQVELEQAKNLYEMVQGLRDNRALSLEAINQRLSNYQQAEAKSDQAKADFEKVKMGAWQPDIKIARLNALQAKANIKRIEGDIERTIIRSPIDGTVLQIRIYPGEMTPMDTNTMPIMVVGNTDALHLRVSINQFDAPYFKGNEPAVAYLQGDASIEIPLEFVRIEPYLIDKQNFTNNIVEAIDTRVLQVIYRLKETEAKIYVGQLMDVFIKNPTGDL